MLYPQLLQNYLDSHSTTLPIKGIIIEPGLSRSPALRDLLPYRHILAVYDHNTYAAAGAAVSDTLADRITDRLCLGTPGVLLHPTKETVFDILAAVTPQTDLILAIGSGTVNDSCRYVAYKTHIPYVIFGTAPSMDGYASTVSPLVVGGFKRTYEAVFPQLVLADSEVLAAAPKTMLSAGWGDIAGKITALADWRLSHVLTGEPINRDVYELMADALSRTLRNTAKIGSGDSEGVGVLMEALVLAGVAMLLSGNSRPASGCEHHMAHYMEMMDLRAGRPTMLHGNAVGMAEFYALGLHEYLWSRDLPAAVYDAPGEAMGASERAAYGGLFADVELENRGLVLPSREVIADRIGEAREYVSGGMPSVAELRSIAASGGFDFGLVNCGVTEAQLLDAFLNSRVLRKRYTAMRLAHQLGLLTEETFRELVV